MSLCIHSQVTITRYIPFSLVALSTAIDQVYEKMVAMFGTDLKLHFPMEKIRSAIVLYKDVVRQEVGHQEFYERSCIVLVFSVREGKCDLCASWLVHDTEHNPVMKSNGSVTLITFQMFNPDLI